MKPPFTFETATQKVRAAENAWSTRDPERVALAYTPDSVWRNRSEFIHGRAEIVAFLRRKWAKELDILSQSRTRRNWRARGQVSGMKRSTFIQAVSGLALTAPAWAEGYHFPLENGPFRAPELVDVQRVESGLKLDIRYATPDNFLHRPLYRQARALLQKPAAGALGRVHRGLQSAGFGLIIFDAYRPWRVTREMAEESPQEWVGTYLADPNVGSRHNRGCAVDLSLFDLATGAEAEMQTPFDDFTAQAHAHSTDCAPQQLERRKLLQGAMAAEGFAAYDPEWWHFDYRDWHHYQVLDIPFERVKRG